MTRPIVNTVFMNKDHPNGSMTAPSRASSLASSPAPNGNALPPPYSDEEPRPTPLQPTGRIPPSAPQRLGHTDGLAHHQTAKTSHKKADSGIVNPEAFEDWEDDAFGEQDPLTEHHDSMPSDLRPPFHRPTDGKSGTPLLNPQKKENGYAGDEFGGDAPRLLRRKSTFKEVDPDVAARSATRKRYTYAAFFLAVSLVSFTIQTETAVYIKKHLGWSKSYGML